MATQQHSDIADRLINSLKSLQKGEWFDTMQTYQDYPMLRVALTMGKEKSGNRLSFRVGVGSENEDGHSGLYEDFDVDRPDVMTEGIVQWRNHRKGFAIDERELDPNQDPESLVDDLEVLRNDMWSRTADDFELKSFQVPSASDKLLPNGIPYWVVWEDSSAGTFTQSYPSGHTDVAGIDPAVQTKYTNFSATYVNPTRDDLGMRVSRAIRQTNWRPPKDVRGDQQVTHAIYMDQTTIEQNEIMAANQNDQLGNDTQPMFNQTMLARIRPTWLPVLDSEAAASSNPVYIINHAYLYPCFKKGWRFREYPPTQAAKQPSAVEVYNLSVYNWACPLRDRQAVVAKAAPFGES
ncbi:MAG: hypothetical protein ACYSWU_02190 [Planctomycetota bacterium]|jgi:hypothetical protein